MCCVPTQADIKKKISHIDISGWWAGNNIHSTSQVVTVSHYFFVKQCFACRARVSKQKIKFVFRYLLNFSKSCSHKSKVWKENSTQVPNEQQRTLKNATLSVRFTLDCKDRLMTGSRTRLSQIHHFVKPTILV